MNNPSVSNKEEAKDSQNKPAEEDTPSGSDQKQETTLKDKLRTFDTKIGYISLIKARGLRSLNAKEILIWAIFVLLMSFSISSPIGLYCIWRKLKRKPVIPINFRWIPTFGNPVPKGGYRDIANQRSIFDRLFKAPDVTKSNQKWLMILGVFVLIIGFGLTVNPTATYLLYGFTPDVLWQYIQCFCIMLAGSFLFKASARIKTEHMREQGMYFLASHFDALPLDYASSIFSIPKQILADDLQSVIDANLLGESFIDYEHWIYDGDKGSVQAPSKKKQRMNYYGQQLQQISESIAQVSLQDRFHTFNQIAQTLVNRSISDELLYKYSIEYLDFYYPLIIALEKGSLQISSLEPTLTEEEAKYIQSKRRRRVSRKNKDKDAKNNPEEVIMQLAYEKKEEGLEAVFDLVDEINGQLQKILEEI